MGFKPIFKNLSFWLFLSRFYCYMGKKQKNAKWHITLRRRWLGYSATTMSISTRKQSTRTGWWKWLSSAQCWEEGREQMRWEGRPHWTCGICDKTGHQSSYHSPGGQCQQHGKLNPTHYATGGPTMPVGPVSGETVDNLLISSVAANTQAHETTAVHQPDPTSDWLEKV